MNDNNTDEMESPIPQEVIDAFKENAADTADKTTFHGLNIMNYEELLADIRKTDPDFNPNPVNVIHLRPQPDTNSYVPLTMEDMKKEIPKPIEFVMAPFLPVQGIGFIYAATGMGKTLFTLNIAHAIAGGGNFLKYSCPKPLRVLYIDGEMPYAQLHERIMLIEKQQGALYSPQNLLFLTPDKVLPFKIPMIDDLHGQNLYISLFEKHNIDVIIFDNLSMLTSIDENKSNEWKIVQDFLLYLRSIGKTILTVHHSGKDKLGYRGSSRMLDCADVAISLQPVNDDCLEEENTFGKKFKIVYQKARMFGGKDALPFEATLENGMWNYCSNEQSDMDKVIALVSLKMNQRDIAKELLLSLSKVNRLIKKAKILKLIRD